MLSLPRILHVAAEANFGNEWFQIKGDCHGVRIFKAQVLIHFLGLLPDLLGLCSEIIFAKDQESLLYCQVTKNSLIISF